MLNNIINLSLCIRTFITYFFLVKFEYIHFKHSNKRWEMRSYFHYSIAIKERYFKKEYVKTQKLKIFWRLLSICKIFHVVAWFLTNISCKWMTTMTWYAGDKLWWSVNVDRNRNKLTRAWELFALLADGKIS